MKEKKIGKRQFRCDKMPATEAALWLFKIGKIISPALSKLGEIRAAAAGEGQAEDLVMGAIGGLLADLDPKEAQNLIVSFAEMAEVRSQADVYESVIFDATFNDDLLLGIQVASWVITVNFGDFFNAKMQDLTKGIKKES